MVMARKTNTGNGETSGHGEADQRFQPSGPVYPDPGPRKHDDPDWVRKDMLFKTQLPRQKFY
jgi:hypothetical protein